MQTTKLKRWVCVKFFIHAKDSINEFNSLHNFSCTEFLSHIIFDRLISGTMCTDLTCAKLKTLPSRNPWLTWLSQGPCWPMLSQFCLLMFSLARKRCENDYYIVSSTLFLTRFYNRTWPSGPPFRSEWLVTISVMHLLPISNAHSLKSTSQLFFPLLLMLSTPTGSKQYSISKSPSRYVPMKLLRERFIALRMRRMYEIWI